jgi:hypothetical protein
MTIEKKEVERMLLDRETPFTDFRVEEQDGLPRAVFDRLPKEQSTLLAYFLYPNLTFVDVLYADAIKVKNGEAQQTTYGDDYFTAMFSRRSVVIETLKPSETNGKIIRIQMPAVDARYLLLKWKFECMRLEAIRQFRRK